MQTFPDEETCRSHFKRQREKEGVQCKKCNCLKHYWLKSKEQWQCKQCSFRTTLRSGTIMENSKLGIHTWYLAMMFMTFSKQGISACELQRQLGVKRYETVWKLMHKIRTAMGKRDDLYTLSDMIEMDEGYFEVQSPANKPLKRGRGSESVQNAMVMAESVPLEDLEKNITSKHCRYFKLKVMQTHQSEEVLSTAEENIEKSSVAFTDDNSSYGELSEIVDKHITEKSDRQTTIGTLKWVHIAIANAKRMIAGVYHQVSRKHLQNYLNEFSYKLNRRYFKNALFERLILASAKSYW